VQPSAEQGGGVAVVRVAEVLEQFFEGGGEFSGVSQAHNGHLFAGELIDQGTEHIFLLAVAVKAVKEGFAVFFALFKFDFETIDQKGTSVFAVGLFAFDGKFGNARAFAEETQEHLGVPFFKIKTEKHKRAGAGELCLDFGRQTRAEAVFHELEHVVVIEHQGFVVADVSDEVVNEWSGAFGLGRLSAVSPERK